LYEQRRRLLSLRFHHFPAVTPAKKKANLNIALELFIDSVTIAHTLLFGGPTVGRTEGSALRCFNDKLQS
jgi:hypothetical protein